MTTMSESAASPHRGASRATMRDVAALAGVGIKTVSRVINDEPNVTAATIAKVTAAAERLDYQPDLNAGNLRRADRKTRTLGLVVGSVANPFSGAIHRGVEDAAVARGVAVFASSLDDDATREERIVTEMLRRRVDGLILTTVRKNQSYLVPEQARGTVARLRRPRARRDRADIVVTNNAEAAGAATAHLHRGRPSQASPTSATGASCGPRRSAAADSSSSSARSASRPATSRSSRSCTPRTPPTRRRCAAARPRPADRDLRQPEPRDHRCPARAARARTSSARSPWSASTTSRSATCSSPASPWSRRIPYEMGRRAAELAFARLDGDRARRHGTSSRAR